MTELNLIGAKIMMNGLLRHVIATLAISCVSIGMMGATPKKSQAAVGVGVTVVACAVGVVVAGACASYIWTTATGHCKAAPGCAALASGACAVPGGACGAVSPIFGACGCKGGGTFFACYC